MGCNKTSTRTQNFMTTNTQLYTPQTLCARVLSVYASVCVCMYAFTSCRECERCRFADEHISRRDTQARNGQPVHVELVVGGVAQARAGLWRRALELLLLQL